MATFKELLFEKFSEELKLLGQINAAIPKASLYIRKTIIESKIDVVRAVNNVYT